MATRERLTKYPTTEDAQLLKVVNARREVNPGYQVITASQYAGRQSMALPKAVMVSTFELFDQVVNNPPAEINIPSSDVKPVVNAFASIALGEYGLEKMTTINLANVTESKRKTENVIDRIEVEAVHADEHEVRLVAAYNELDTMTASAERNSRRLCQFLRELPEPYRVAIIGAS